MHYCDRMEAEEFCNLCITLINQATYMLRRMLETQQQQFLANGGIKELMYRARTGYRVGNGYAPGANSQTRPTSPTGPTFPKNKN